MQRIGVQQALFLLSHLLLLGFVWRNRRLPGIQIVGLGVMCNLLVIAANGGLMPITPETLVQINPGSTLAQWPVGAHYGHSKDIILLRAEIRLWALSDILVIPPPFPRPTAFSLGDLLIASWHCGFVARLRDCQARRSGNRSPLNLSLCDSYSPPLSHQVGGQGQFVFPT